MRDRVTVYVSVTIVAAILAVAALFEYAPEVGTHEIRAVMVLAMLGLASEILAHNITAGAVGSIAFVPFLALSVLVPTWASPVAVGLVAGLASVLRGARGVKPIFNLAQTTLAASVAIAAFLAGGGAPLLDGLAGSHAFRWATLGAVFLATIGYMLTNVGVVSGVIGISEGRRVLPIWRGTVERTLRYDVAASPVVYLLAWLYAQFGTWGAVLFAAPLLVLREVYKTNRQLERVNHELLELMVKAIEARDPYTSGHSRRVSQYSRIIARAVGLGGAEIERVSVVALLHDVGKIHEIYAPILRKPEKLSPAEWAVMQTHPIKSSELVGTVSHLKDIVAPVKHHHENWDGSGYPDGLQGDAIPIAARVVLFADTIDAMTTDRPYRKALSESQVRSELIKFRGKQFDPEMCDKLLASPMFGLLFSPNQREKTPEESAPAASVRTEVVALQR